MSRAVRLGLLVLLIVWMTSLVGVPAASASTDFSWSGGGAEALWSLGDNWVGGLSPSGSIGTLTFGDLGAACDSGASSDSCYQSNHDAATDITVDRLDIADNEPYELLSSTNNIVLDGDSNGIGIASAPAEPESAGGVADIAAPIELGSDQTWEIERDGQSSDGLEVDNVVDSTNYSLDLQLGGTFYTTQVDTAVLSAEGDGYIVLQHPGLNDPAQLPDTVLSEGAGLEVTAAGADSDSLTAGLTDPDNVSIGQGVAHDGTLAVTGNVTLGSQASLDFFIDQPESTTYPPDAGTPPTPSYDFSQLTASGTVDLGQANLNLYLGTSSTSDCRDLVPGQMYPIISAGTIAGELDYDDTPITNGGTIPLQNDCNGVTSTPTVAIFYDTASLPETVTAEVVSGGHAGDLPVLNGNSPTISDTSPVAGSQLQASTGDWSETPTSYDYEWYSCSASAGPDCDNTVGTDAPAYTPTAADAGNTIEVCVSATNAYGTSTYEYCSDPTNPVSLPPPPTITGSEPSITGNDQVGGTLTSSPGTWSGSPTFTYQWQLCATQGSDCTNIQVATGSSYTLTSGDVGQYIRLEITATNIGGYTVVTLTSTEPVASPTAQAPPTTVTTSTTPPTISATQIRSALDAIGHPSGKNAIAALIKTGLFKTVFHAPAAGSLSVIWRTTITSGQGKHRTHTTITIASGSADANTAAAITVTLRLTGAGKALLRTKRSGLIITGSEEFKSSGGARHSATKKFSL